MMEKSIPYSLDSCPYGCPDGCVADFGKMIEEGRIGEATKMLETKVYKHKWMVRSGNLDEGHRREVMRNMVWDQVGFNSNT